jgi:hypothetical protein
MKVDKQQVIETLRYELNFLEQGGYDHKVSGEGLPSPFRTGFSCINFGDPLRRHACHECDLYEFVPENARTDDAPCHGIELEPGLTIGNLLASGERQRMVTLLEKWLREMIARLEREETLRSAS